MSRKLLKSEPVCSKITKMKIKTSTVSLNGFFVKFSFFIKVYCCSKKTHCDRYRIYYKTNEDTIQVQINSPEGLAWPGTEFETEAELIKPFPDYHHADQFFSKYVTIQ